jgi:DNA-binding NarL/FixJ family response regulator
MKAGASGFLLKSVPRDQLVNGVRVVARGEALLAPAPTRRLIEAFVRRPPPGAQAPEQLAALSPREIDVFRALARGRSNAEIASELYLSANTVRTHLRHIYAKLDAHSRSEAVTRARELGLIARAMRG